jgi:hypothetical protein
MQDGLEFSATGLILPFVGGQRGTSDFYKTWRQAVRIVAAKITWPTGYIRRNGRVHGGSIVTV